MLCFLYIFCMNLVAYYAYSNSSTSTAGKQSQWKLHHLSSLSSWKFSTHFNSMPNKSCRLSFLPGLAAHTFLPVVFSIPYSVCRILCGEWYSVLLSAGVAKIQSNRQLNKLKLNSLRKSVDVDRGVSVSLKFFLLFHQSSFYNYNLEFGICMTDLLGILVPTPLSSVICDLASLFFVIISVPCPVARKRMSW